MRSEEPIIMCVVGNKCDMNNFRQVPFREGADYANSIGALYHEASALSSEGNSNILCLCCNIDWSLLTIS